MRWLTFVFLTSSLTASEGKNKLAKLRIHASRVLLQVETVWPNYPTPSLSHQIGFPCQHVGHLVHLNVSRHVIHHVIHHVSQRNARVREALILKKTVKKGTLSPFGDPPP